MSATRPPALVVRGVQKRYGDRVALAGVSFTVPTGAFHVLLGPNGAGKSTLYQLLTGLFAADEGDAELAGHSIRRTPVAALRHLGVVFQQPSLDLDLTVARNLGFHARLHGLSAREAAPRIAAVLAALGLEAERDRAVRELSGGTRRKVELARALLHAPALLLMDEPTVGLDPKSRRDLIAAIRADVATRGSSVLWATHLVEEAVQADRVLVLHLGRLLAEGAPGAVAAALGGGTLEDAFIRATAARVAPDPRSPHMETPA